MTIADRAWCTRSREGEEARTPCANAACDRFANPAILAMAQRGGLRLIWADLMTQRCGYQPRNSGGES